MPYSDEVFNQNLDIITWDDIANNLYNRLIKNVLHPDQQISSACPVNLMIIDNTGNRFGFDATGTFINELPECRYVKIPTDSITTDSLTIIYAPNEQNYEVVMNCYDVGNMLFTINKPGVGNLISYYADSVQVYHSTFIQLDEANLNEGLKVDYNNDGIIDTIITLIYTITSQEEGFNTKNNYPTKFLLSQNYPNPFNRSTLINFEIPKQSNVS